MVYRNVRGCQRTQRPVIVHRVGERRAERFLVMRRRRDDRFADSIRAAETLTWQINSVQFIAEQHQPFGDASIDSTVGTVVRSEFEYLVCMAAIGLTWRVRCAAWEINVRSGIDHRMDMLQILVGQVAVRGQFAGLGVWFIHDVSRLVEFDPVVVGNIELNVSRSLLREARREAMSGERDRLHPHRERLPGLERLVALVQVDAYPGFQQVFTPFFEPRGMPYSSTPAAFGSG